MSDKASAAEAANPANDAETREQATAKLIAALRQFRIDGVRTNLPFVVRVLGSDAFRHGSIDTAFLDRESEAIAATIDPSTHQSAINNQQSTISPKRYDPWDGPHVSVAPKSAATTSRRKSSRGSAGRTLVAPMPATVIKIHVKPGDEVKKGDPVVVLEAMKMELPVRALADATIAAVCCREGELVQADATLVEFA